MPEFGSPFSGLKSDRKLSREELIRAILPDVLVKGADYTVATVVGADIVQAHGGKVLLAELMPGHSTSATIKRMGR